jgi:hypothetical protein
MAGSQPIASTSTASTSSFNPGTLMAASAAVQGLSSLGSAFAQSGAYQLQGDYQKQQSEINAQLAEYEADDAIKRGDKSAKALRTQIKGLVGAQRASFAAQGIALDSGSALDVQADTSKLGALDVLTLKNNALREAFGYKTQAISDNARGNFAGLAADMNSRSTLLTGGLNAVNSGLSSLYYYGKK